MSLGIAAGLIGLVAYCSYILAVLRGEMRPSRASWIIWTLSGWAIALSYWSSGARETVWFALAMALGATIVMLLSIKQGVGGWSKLDQTCLTTALLGIALWISLGSPEIALLANITVEFAGAAPTVKKLIDGHREDGTAWALMTTGSIINIAALESWSFALGVYPLYQLMINGSVLSLVVLTWSIGAAQRPGWFRLLRPRQGRAW